MFPLPANHWNHWSFFLHFCIHRVNTELAKHMVIYNYEGVFYPIEIVDKSHLQLPFSWNENHSHSSIPLKSLVFFKFYTKFSHNRHFILSYLTPEWESFKASPPSATLARFLHSHFQQIHCNSPLVSTFSTCKHTKTFISTETAIFHCNSINWRKSAGVGRET